MKSTDERRITRRQFGQLGAGLVVAGGALLFGRPARAEAEKPVADYPDNEALITAIQYKEKSEVAGSTCANCILYTAGSGDRGKCSLFMKGTVAADGHCTSWAAKPA